MSQLKLFQEAIDKLTGRTYGSLNAKEKQTVYAMEIWNDSGDARVTHDIWTSTTLTPEFIDDQNRNTFEYTDNIRIGDDQREVP